MQQEYSRRTRTQAFSAIERIKHLRVHHELPLPL